MYWYYKYPLLGILLLLLFGVGYVIWRSQGSDDAETVIQEETAAAVPALPEPAPPSAVPVAPRPPATPTLPAPSVPTTPANTAALPVPSPWIEEPPAQAVRLIETARNQLAAGNLETGRELARRAMNSEGVVEFDRTWYQGAAIISEANTIFMNSGAPCGDKVGYLIQPGDNLTVIANRLRTTVGALQRMNPEMLAGTTARIYPGRTLFALRADWSIRVSKAQHVLLLYNGPDLFKLYHVALGRENRTPVGTFDIVNKVFHPDWTHPSGEVIPYGDKRNILGTHWLAFRPTGPTDPTLRGFGIHGTWEPESIGTDASLGCVRMRNEEVAELYDFIPFPRGENITSVTIE